MTLSSYAFSHCSAPRAPGVRPGASKSDFEGAATAGGLVRGASSRSGLRSRRALLGRTAASCWCPGRSHGQTGTLMISSGSAHLSDTCFHCPSSRRSDISNQSVLAGLHPETDEYARFHPVFGLRSICQRTQSIPHSFSARASAHVVSATSPPFERYLPIGPNRVQVQQRGGVPNYLSNGL